MDYKMGVEEALAGQNSGSTMTSSLGPQHTMLSKIQVEQLVALF